MTATKQLMLKRLLGTWSFLSEPLGTHSLQLQRAGNHENRPRDLDISDYESVIVGGSPVLGSARQSTMLSVRSPGRPIFHLCSPEASICASRMSSGKDLCELAPMLEPASREMREKDV